MTTPAGGRGRPGAPSFPSPPPSSAAAPDPAVQPDDDGRPDRARWVLEDAVAAAEADVARAERHVRIAELLLEELAEDAPASDRAIADDRSAGATEALVRARTRLQRRVDLLREAEAVAAGPGLPLLVYTDADTWVRSWLLPCWRRPLRQRWCPKWWLHAEAVSRFEALWRAWEHLRGEGALGPSVWWRDHADHHLAVLTSERGPFAACSPDRGHRATADELPAVADPLDLADFVGRARRRPA